MKKAKKTRVPASFVRFLIVPCLITAQAAPVHAKSKKQEGGRSTAVVKNPMDPILGCMKANELATRRLSNPKWAVRGQTTVVHENYQDTDHDGLLVQTTKVQSQTGATYEKDFAWIPTPEGAAKIDVTGVPRNTVAYVRQPLPISYDYNTVGFGFGGPTGGNFTSDLSTVPPQEKTLKYVEVAYSPGKDPRQPVSKTAAANRLANAYRPPKEDFFPELQFKSFEKRGKLDRVLTAEWKKNEPGTRKVFLDEMKKRFEEYSIQSERERLATFSEDPKFGRIIEHWDQQEKYLEAESEVLDQLEAGLLTEQMKKENQETSDKIYDQWNKLIEEKERFGAEALKSTTFKDFLSGLKGCKAALEKDHWNEDEEFAPFYRSVVAELDRLKELQRRARSGQTPSSGKKSGAGNATGAGQAQ